VAEKNTGEGGKKKVKTIGYPSKNLRKEWKKEDRRAENQSRKRKRQMRRIFTKKKKLGDTMPARLMQRRGKFGRGPRAAEKRTTTRREDEEEPHSRTR